jgi:TatD DNase family protein
MTNSRSLQTNFELQTKYDTLLIAAGVHPHKAKYYKPAFAQKTKELASANKIVAVGEIGLDFHYNLSPPQVQIETFRYQLRTAQDLALPVIIHSRKAGLEVVSSIKAEHFSWGGILHCFSEEWEIAKRMMNHNFLISISGILTYPKAHALRNIVRKMPLEKLLIETDSPYLSPLPYRNKNQRNEPSYVVETAKTLAALKEVSLIKLAVTTTRNFKSLFKFEKKNIRC